MEMDRPPLASRVVGPVSRYCPDRGQTLLKQNVGAEARYRCLARDGIATRPPLHRQRNFCQNQCFSKLWMPCYAVAGGSSLAGGVFLSSTGRGEARIQSSGSRQSSLFFPLGSSANVLLQRRVLYIRHSKDATITGSYNVFYNPPRGKTLYLGKTTLPREARPDEILLLP